MWKGRVVGMEKVKVTRYMTGKRPDWAPEEFDSDEELQLQAKKITIKKPGNVEIEKVSIHMRRLFWSDQRSVDTGVTLCPCPRPCHDHVGDVDMDTGVHFVRVHVHRPLEAII